MTSDLRSICVVVAFWLVVLVVLDEADLGEGIFRDLQLWCQVVPGHIDVAEDRLPFPIGFIVLLLAMLQIEEGSWSAPSRKRWKH